MINSEEIRTTLVTGIRNYTNCPVIRSNQTGEPPSYPFISYTVTALKTANNGTYGVYEDGKARKPVTQTWSLTVQSDRYEQVTDICLKVHEWLDYTGQTFLSDNGVIIQSVGNISNRDNLISIEYEYRQGFDFVINCMDEVDSIAITGDTIETFYYEQEEKE